MRENFTLIKLSAQKLLSRFDCELLDLFRFVPYTESHTHTHIDREIRTYICVELASKAREVIVLEESGEETGGKSLWIPDNEAVFGLAPRHNMIGS